MKKLDSTLIFRLPSYIKDAFILKAGSESISSFARRIIEEYVENGKIGKLERIEEKKCSKSQ